MFQLTRGRFLGLFLLLVFFTSIVVWFVNKRYAPRGARTDAPPSMSLTASPIQPSPSPVLSPSIEPSNSPPPQQPLDTPVTEATPLDDQQAKPLTEADRSYVGELKLIIPVQGATADQLRDTFAEARSEGRVHDAIDIPAPQGTPVFAVADGEIAKLFQSVRGGTTIYQFSNDKKMVYYYAHLQRYADGLTEGKIARQGEVIGYVGDTGNAGAGNYHLHFSIAILADPKRYWEGTNINPYPLLHK